MDEILLLLKGFYIRKDYAAERIYMKMIIYMKRLSQKRII